MNDKKPKPKPSRGRILRVKKGFNPNSSSIATDIVVFFTGAAGVSAIFAAAAAVVMARFSDKGESKEDTDGKPQNN